MGVMRTGRRASGFAAMTKVGHQPRDVLASVEQQTLNALAGIDGLLDRLGGAPPGGPPRAGLRMIVAERQVRELARRAQLAILELLSAGGLRPDELGLAAALLHTSQIVAQMCDEYVDLGLLGDLEEPDGDDQVTVTLGAMRSLTRRQVRVAAEAFTTPPDAVARRLETGHAEIDNGNREIIERALVGEDGAVRHEALGSAVIAAECLTRISEHALDIGDSATRLISAPPRAVPQSPV
jgi:hypothetical protein